MGVEARIRTPWDRGHGGADRRGRRTTKSLTLVSPLVMVTKESCSARKPVEGLGASILFLLGRSLGVVRGQGQVDESYGSRLASRFGEMVTCCHPSLTLNTSSQIITGHVQTENVHYRPPRKTKDVS